MSTSWSIKFFFQKFKKNGKRAENAPNYVTNAFRKLKKRSSMPWWLRWWWVLSFFILPIHSRAGLGSLVFCWAKIDFFENAYYVLWRQVWLIWALPVPLGAQHMLLYNFRTNWSYFQVKTFKLEQTNWRKMNFFWHFLKENLGFRGQHILCNLMALVG